MSYDRDKRRERRRRNAIAKDLRTPKYRQRVVPKKNKKEKDIVEIFEEYDTGRCLGCDCDDPTLGCLYD